MSLSSVYVSPELMAFAKRADVSAVHLAAAIADADLSQLTADELAKLRASCSATPPRKPDLARAIRAVMQV